MERDGKIRDGKSAMREWLAGRGSLASAAKSERQQTVESQANPEIHCQSQVQCAGAMTRVRRQKRKQNNKVEQIAP